MWSFPTPLTLQRPAREHVHKGGSGAETLRTCSPLVQHPNSVASTCDVLRRRFMGRTPFADVPSADSCGSSLIQGFAFWIPAPSACARSLLVPGTRDLTGERSDAAQQRGRPDPNQARDRNRASCTSDASLQGRPPWSPWQGRHRDGPQTRYIAFGNPACPYLGRKGPRHCRSLNCLFSWLFSLLTCPGTRWHHASL